MSNLVIRDDVESSDFYEEYFEWIMDRSEGGYKDLYIGRYEDGWRFDDFIEERHPECLVPE